MRISADPLDPGFGRYLNLMDQSTPVTIYLNDVEIEDVITADDEAGKVRAYLRDESGRLMVDPETGHVCAQTFTGEVRIPLNLG